MAIPDYQSIMLPLLKFASDKKEHSIREAIEYLTAFLDISEEESKELLPSGKEPIFDNRVRWARLYLKKADILETTKRGFFKITKRGEKVLKEELVRIDNKYLEKFPEFLEFREGNKKGKEEDIDTIDEQSEQTPEEILEYTYQKIRHTLGQELLTRAKSSTPSFFEKLVVELLLKMGYGGSRKDAGQAIGKSGDGGIDGIIKEDRLGLDVIYIQAKRWEGTVGRPEIQKFVGALHGQRAKKGVFITTSHFSNEAKDYVSQIDSKIVLIDGDQLAQLMIDFGIGVSTVATYEIKDIDSDYFSEE